MSLKKSLFFIAISALIAVNLAIQIARFNSYTLFMKGLKFNIGITELQQSSTDVKAAFSFDLQTNEEKVHAYVSGIQLVLKAKNVDLGYHPIVGDQSMLGEFKNGKFHYVSEIEFLDGQATNLLIFSKKRDIDYKAYVELHVTQGGHDLRSVPMFVGKVNVGEAIK
jgi:hypothetical protein